LPPRLCRHANIGLLCKQRYALPPCKHRYAMQAEVWYACMAADMLLSGADRGIFSVCTGWRMRAQGASVCIDVPYFTSYNVYACMHRPGQSKDRLWAGWRGIRLLCSATDALRASWATDSNYAAGQIGWSRAGLPDAAPRQRLSRTLTLVCRTLTGVEELDAALQCQAEGRARKTEASRRSRGVP
jgi:hypothetical protein